MTVLMAFDPATTCGWATYEDMGRGRKARVECGSFTAVGDSEGELFSNFARKASALIVERRPTRIAVERRIPSNSGRWEVDVSSKSKDMVGGKVWKPNKSDDSNKRQDGLRGVLLATIAAPRPRLGLPVGFQYEEVATNSWHKSFFGEGTKPPQPPATVKPTSYSTWRRSWWKREAKMKADALGLDMGFVVPNSDAADAVGIVFWLAANFHHLEALDLFHKRATA